MRLMVLAISNKLRLFFGILLALILFQSTLQAQITASSANYSTVTAYTTGEDQNDIFVFSDEAGVNVGELKAVSPDGNSGWDFTWTKWDGGTNTFGASINNDNGQESTVSGLEDGLYQVTIEKGSEMSDYLAWVVNYTKDANKPSLSFDRKNCSGVYFESTYTPIVQIHEYDNYPTTSKLNVSAPITNPINFVLKRGHLNAGFSNEAHYNGTLVILLDNDAYAGTSFYKVMVIDRYGFEFDSDPIENISTYVVDPSFSFTPETGEAPLDVDFKIENENNSATYEWFLYNAIDRIDGPVEIRDSLLNDDTFDMVRNYSYMHPGVYDVKVIAISKDDESCRYISDLKTVTVEVSLFEVPNVFTPNGDGANDEFKLRLYSVKSYSVKIFNRWGRLVYEFQESDVSAGMVDRKSSKGWDGKINGKLASPGTYFYVVEAEGREEEGKHYTEKGSLTLLHNK